MSFFIDHELAHRLECMDMAAHRDCVEASRNLDPSTGATFEPMAGGYAFFIGHDSPLSQAIGLGLNGPVIAEDIDELDHFYKNRNMPAQVELCPMATPGLLGLLTGRGYQPTGFTNLMVRSLNSDTDDFPTTFEAMEVREAEPKEADLWIHVVTEGFTEKPDPEAHELNVATVQYHMQTSHPYLVWLEGRPVGGGAMAIQDKIAYLFSTSVLPMSRDRGVQKALMRFCLARAVKDHCNRAMVITEPGSASQRNAERLGFGVAYTRVMMTHA